MHYEYREEQYNSYSELRKAVKERPSQRPVYFVGNGFKRKIHTKPKTSDLNFRNE